MTTFFVRRKGDCSGKETEVLSAVDGYFVFRGGAVIPISECERCAHPEQLEDVTTQYRGLAGVYGNSIYLRWNDKMTYIDGLHHGPAFIVERKKS